MYMEWMTWTDVLDSNNGIGEWRFFNVIGFIAQALNRTSYLRRGVIIVGTIYGFVWYASFRSKQIRESNLNIKNRIGASL